MGPLVGALVTSKLKRSAKFTAQRWHVIAGEIQRRGWTKGVELGVLDGKCFFYLLARFPELHMAGVDIWMPQPDQDAFWNEGGRSYGSHDLDAYYDFINRKIDARGLGERTHLIRDYTVNAADQIADRSVDFVFIDADHTYGGVKEDIAAWAPKVREGGALMGHDAGDAKFPGVTQAINELLPGWKLRDDKVWFIPIEQVSPELRGHAPA
jgi:hypothetical protein